MRDLRTDHPLLTTPYKHGTTICGSYFTNSSRARAKFKTKRLVYSTMVASDLDESKNRGVGVQGCIGGDLWYERSQGELEGLGDEGGSKG